MLQLPLTLELRSRLIQAFAEWISALPDGAQVQCVATHHRRETTATSFHAESALQSALSDEPQGGELVSAPPRIRLCVPKSTLVELARLYEVATTQGLYTGDTPQKAFARGLTEMAVTVTDGIDLDR